MPAYVLVDIEVQDPERYREYTQVAPASIAGFGGRYLVRGGHTEVLEGDWQPGRFVILEFESLARAKAWWDSQQYAEPKRMRQAASRTNMIVAEGL
jgi:uncharacterized protein (DUF1330 family)